MNGASGLTTDNLAPAESRALGRWLLPMLLHWDQWVHRRVTTLSFVNERQVYRHVSVDFTIPTWRISPEDSSAANMHVIPITLLEKRHDVLKNVNVVDEAGRSIPIMVTQEVWGIVRGMLEDLFRAAMYTPKLSNTQLEDIEQIVCAPPVRAQKYRDKLISQLIGLHEDQISKAAAIAFAALADDLADNFLLVALVSGEPGRRRVLKFDYEDEAKVSYHRPALWAPGNGWGHLIESAKTWLLFIAVQVGLAPLPIVLGVRDVAYALSYHLELPSPDGLYLRRACFDKYEEDNWKLLASSGPSERAHLYLYNQPRSIRTRLRAEFRMQPADWPTLGLTSAALTFGILLAGVILHQGFGRHADIGGAAAVLAVLPGALAAMYLRSGEHPILRWMVRGIRLIVVSLMTLSLASAGSLAVRPALPSGVWLFLTAASFLFVCLMVGTFVKSWRPPDDADEEMPAQGVR